MQADAPAGKALRLGKGSIFGGILFGVIFAILGFIAGVYAFSFGDPPDLPTPLLLLLCPAALIGGLLSPSADTDTAWVLVVFNAFLYGAAGTLLGKLIHIGQE